MPCADPQNVAKASTSKDAGDHLPSRKVSNHHVRRGFCYRNLETDYSGLWMMQSASAGNHSLTSNMSFGRECYRCGPQAVLNSSPC